MADIKFIDKETIINLIAKYGFTDQDIEKIYSVPTSFIEYTKKLCNLYLKYLNLGTDKALKASHALGGIIIFNLRKFVVNKDITLMAGIMANGKQLQTVQMPLTDVLANTNNYSIDSEGLKLTSAIESYENFIYNVNRQQSSVWKKILDASELHGSNSGDFTTNNGPDEQFYNSKKELKNAYRRLSIDKNVYYVYSGNHQISKYYKIDDGTFKLFNNGWLFEHFMTKWANADTDLREVYISESNGSHPLKNIIQDVDSIPGYQGGDFRWRGRDYQAKYGNDKIITIKSIKKIMEEIIYFLNRYEKEKKFLYKKLVEEFTNKKNMDLQGAEEEINQYYSDIVKKMINSLAQRGA